jgi:hypothetical protein
LGLYTLIHAIFDQGLAADATTSQPLEITVLFIERVEGREFVSHGEAENSESIVEECNGRLRLPQKT